MQIHKTHVRLIARLKAKQEEMGLNDFHFAVFLGISPSKLSKLYSQEQGIGAKTLSALMTKAPEIFLPEYMQIVQAEGQKE